MLAFYKTNIFLALLLIGIISVPFSKILDFLSPLLFKVISSQSVYNFPFIYISAPFTLLIFQTYPFVAVTNHSVVLCSNCCSKVFPASVIYFENYFILFLLKEKFVAFQEYSH